MRTSNPYLERRIMDFGGVVLEYKPIIICQCKYELCAVCQGPVDSPEHDNGGEPTEDIPNAHGFYQRSRVWGPRVAINPETKMGKCSDCGKEYLVEVKLLGSSVNVT